MKTFFQKHEMRKSFTLIEIMIVLTIMGVITAGAMTMFRDGLEVCFRTQAKLEVNSYIRKATNRMVFEGRRASYFLLYDRFDGSNAIIPPSATPSFVNFRDAAFHNRGRRTAGERGSCLVFVYNGVNPQPFNPASRTPIDRIVVFTLDTRTISSNGVYRMRTFELNLDPSDTRRLDPVETLIPVAVSGAEPASRLHVFVPLARGMLGGHLFQNLDGKSVLINAHFFYGNPSDDNGTTAGVRSATNTYSFTITPRGSV